MSTFKSFSSHPVFHRHKCVPGPQWQLRSTVSQQQSDSVIVIDVLGPFSESGCRGSCPGGFYWFDNIAGYSTQYYLYYCNILLLHVVTRTILYLYLQLLLARCSESATTWNYAVFMHLPLVTTSISCDPLFLSARTCRCSGVSPYPCLRCKFSPHVPWNWGREEVNKGWRSFIDSQCIADVPTPR